MRLYTPTRAVTAINQQPPHPPTHTQSELKRGRSRWLNTVSCLTHYQTTNFRVFQTERFADGNFKFDENGRKLSKHVENTVGKGELLVTSYFSFSDSVF